MAENETIHLQPYLVITDAARTWGYRITKDFPKLADNEIAIKLDLVFPKSLFKRPSLEAKITINKSSVPPQTISAETIARTEDLIAQGLGFNVNLSVLQEISETEE